MGTTHRQNEKNKQSYSLPTQVAIYDDEKLKPIEQELFDVWFKDGGKKVLDVGCGAGRTTAHLKKRGYDVVAIDYVEAMIKRAREKFPQDDFRVMDATQLAFGDNSFDIALFSFNGVDCIYPEKKREEAIREMRRVIKPGGHLIFSSHNSLIVPKTKYEWFWWALNILTGKIFTPYRLEYKSVRHGARFIYFARQPYRQIRDIERMGFVVKDVFKQPDSHSLMLSPWTYFVCEKV